MKNIFKKFLCFIAILYSIFSFSAIHALAQEPIYVKINGTILIYNDAQPQITNQRAMVPIRETAESLGATIQWNKTTETMTITKGNFVAVHQMYTNVITVNGVATTIDTPSINVNNRTLMPVLMLSKAIGSEVSWDSSTRTVNIITDSASVISAVASESNVNSGEKVVFTVYASSGTEKIKIVDISDNSIIAENTTYTTSSDGTNIFTISWTPSVSKSTYKLLKVVAGTSQSYNDTESSYKVVPISITADEYGKIVEVSSNKTEVARGDQIKLTIKTDSSAQKVKIVDETNSTLNEVVNYTIENGLNIFETTMKFNNRGEVVLKIYPGNSTGYSSNYKTLTITVNSTGSSDSTTLNATLTIHDINIVNTNNYVGEKTELKVITSSDISKVVILNEDGTILDTVYSPVLKDTANNKYTWSTLAYINKEGTNKFKVVAYNSDGYTTSESISLVGISYRSSDLHIISVTQSDYNAIIGDEVKFTVKTTSAADKIVVMNGNTEITTVTNYTSSDGFKTWTFRVKITEANKDNLRVVAYDGNLTDSVKLSSYISSAQSASIIEIKLHTEEVLLNEYIRITVYTNTSVAKVWVEDASGYRVASPLTTCTRQNGNEYEWDFKIPADEVGSRVLYNVYAQDGNGATVDDYFRVKVVKE